MARDLQSLLISAGAGTSAGYNFDDHVGGSDAGIGFNDYILGSLGYTNTPVPGGGATYYVDNHLFQMGVQITEGSRLRFIRRQGAPLSIWTFAGVGPSAGYSATIEAQSVGYPEASNYVNVRVRAPAALASGFTISSAWTITSPAGSGDPQVRNVYPVMSGGAGGAIVNVDFTLQYLIDTGYFNQQEDRPYTFDMVTRSDSNANWEFGWATNSDFSRGYTEGPNRNVTTYEGETHTIYMRARRVGASTWTNYGSHSFTDTR